jgi:hypothetical protein
VAQVLLVHRPLLPLDPLLVLVLQVEELLVLLQGE